jgi:GcrA cell cycle regulator
MTTNTRWTDAETESLRTMWLRGDTVQEIAHTLGRNKNEILGKKYRMGLPLRQEGTRNKPMEEAPPAHRTCQYPHGDPQKPDFHFCGGKPQPGKPYCAAHMAVTYTKYRTRREAQQAVEARMGGLFKVIEREAREMKG